MAYPYYPANYYPGQNIYPAYPQMVQPQQAVPQTVAQTSMTWISGEQEAMLYPVAPNNAVYMRSQTEPVLYVKQADATGKPTMTVYDLVERNAAQPVQHTGPTSEYATKDELNAVIADIETMKGDLYGVAGKKRVKRNDADDE